MFPCPDFDAFMTPHAITINDINFISNLPSYIIPTGNQILEEDCYIKLPNQDWLPAPLDIFSMASALFLLPFYPNADLGILLLPNAHTIPVVHHILVNVLIPMALMIPPCFLGALPTTTCFMSQSLSWGAQWDLMVEFPPSPTAAMGGDMATMGGGA